MPLTWEAPTELSGIRFTVTYSILGEADDACRVAEDICVEQTVEFPAELLPQTDYWRQMMGIITGFESITASKHLARISFAIETLAPNIVQLLNVVYGNISMIPGIRVEDIELPAEILNYFRGPKFGRAGLRELTRVYNRPLLCGTLKPMGLPPELYAQMAYEYALGGMDIVKDDHGITDQAFAPFTERVLRCAEAVHNANAQTGANTLFAANVSGPVETVVERAAFAQDAGAHALLVLPSLLGWDVVRSLGDSEDLYLPLIIHPAFHGVYYASNVGGFSARTIYSTIVRLVGGDISIFPNYVGRLSATKEDCLAVIEAAETPMEHIRSIFPAPGGGTTLQNIPELAATYGTDVVYVMGGGLHHGDSLIESCRLFRSMVEPAELK